MPRDILDAVLPHAETLESLYLHMEEDCDKQWQWSDHPERLYMGIGLRQMYALKTLTICMQTLTGMLAYLPEDSDPNAESMPLKIEGAARIVDCLPETLESLKIRECGMVILDQVVELIKAIEEGRFKNLAYIGLLFNDWEMKQKIDHPEVKKQLVFSAANVRLEFSFQIESEYLFDLGQTTPAVFSASDGVREQYADLDQQRNIMSRIYAPHARRCYREVRGWTRSREDWRLWDDDFDLIDE
ncbi:unnamed protein product [Clonostachys rosea]|uniref:Uncharacterized protein n=1 Tax=Bionectria ochroleuca TaxID=29856 RepID=A0ABY6UC58_BIOOC|nr:unnamed protein product [Clonostachys rosea]